MRRCARGPTPRRPAERSLWSSLPDACDHPRVRVITPEMRKPTRSVADIFSGEVDSFAGVGGEHSTDLRLSQIHYKSGACHGCHTHTTYQNLLCTDGYERIATDDDQHDRRRGR